MVRKSSSNLLPEAATVAVAAAAATTRQAGAPTSVSRRSTSNHDGITRDGLADPDPCQGGPSAHTACMQWASAPSPTGKHHGLCFNQSRCRDVESVILTDSGITLVTPFDTGSTTDFPAFRERLSACEGICVGIFRFTCPGCGRIEASSGGGSVGGVGIGGGFGSGRALAWGSAPGTNGSAGAAGTSDGGISSVLEDAGMRGMLEPNGTVWLVFAWIPPDRPSDLQDDEFESLSSALRGRVAQLNELASTESCVQPQRSSEGDEELGCPIGVVVSEASALDPEALMRSFLSAGRKGQEVARRFRELRWRHRVCLGLLLMFVFAVVPIMTADAFFTVCACSCQRRKFLCVPGGLKDGKAILTD